MAYTSKWSITDRRQGRNIQQKTGGRNQDVSLTGILSSLLPCTVLASFLTQSKPLGMAFFTVGLAHLIQAVPQSGFPLRECFDMSNLQLKLTRTYIVITLTLTCTSALDNCTELCKNSKIYCY